MDDRRKTKAKDMSHFLVKFVEDGLYHVCPKSHVKYQTDEVGLVSAKYKGMYFRAAVIAEGDKQKMEELLERIKISDELSKKYKFTSPVSATVTSSFEQCSTSQKQNVTHVARNLFGIDEMSGILVPSVSTTAQTYSEQEHLNYCHPPPYHLIESDTNSNESNDNTHNDQPEQINNSKEDTEMIQHETIPRLPTETPSCKRYYCPYCRQLISKFARHLFAIHSGEQELLKVANLPPKNKERLIVISRLRAQGSMLYNNQKSSPSKVLLTRQKTPIVNYDYIQCHLCGNMYKKTYLHRHIKKCPNADGTSKHAVRTAKIVNFTVENESDYAIQLSKDVLSGMRDPEIQTQISSDPLLKDYGLYVCASYGEDKHLINKIRSKLRHLAKILKCMKDVDNEILCMEDIFQPSKKHKLFDVIKQLTGFSKGSFTRPTLANELYTLLQQCANRLQCRAQLNGDIEKNKLVSRWLFVVKSDYSALISKHARKALDKNKWNKPRLLPLTDDVLKLNNKVKIMTDNSKKNLITKFDYTDWRNLNKGTMIKLLIFNRKRVGDIERMTLEDFKKCHNVQKDSVTYQLLSESEKVISSEYMRVEVRGKHAKVVPILLDKDTMDSMRTIISLRNVANIPSNNPYVFAQKDEKHFSAAKALSELAYSCEAKNPQLLTGTRLRKQIATTTQAFNFTENELSILANFLGHNLQTHRNFYRLPDEALQLAKISKVLQLIDSGRAEELKGKSLNDLENLVVEMFDEDQDKEEDECEEEKKGPDQIKTTGKEVKVIRRTWTTPQKSVMRKYFKRHLENYTLPTPLECYEALNKFSPLKTRTVAQIKAWVFNRNNKNRKIEKT